MALRSSFSANMCGKEREYVEAFDTNGSRHMARI